ncbi:MAG: GNAT family N-acetyltransferase [Pseudomonadota bacterium]
MASIVFRSATPSDAARLSTYARHLFVQTYAEFNEPANFQRYLDGAFGEEIQHAQLTDPDKLTVVAETGDTYAGYYQVIFNGAVPDCVNTKPVAELARFYVDPDYHGLGLAQRQITDMFEKVALRAAGVWLGVWKENPRAIRFYEKAGMRDVGETSFLLGDDLQQDRVFLREFGNAR